MSILHIISLRLRGASLTMAMILPSLLHVPGIHSPPPASRFDDLERAVCGGTGSTGPGHSIFSELLTLKSHRGSLLLVLTYSLPLSC